MATATKYHCLTRDLASKVHDLYGSVTGTGTNMDDLYAALTNRAPVVAGDSVLADVIEIANGNGYTTGGADCLAQGSWASGVITITSQHIVWTATGSLGPFTYAVIYNNTASGDPLMWYYTYGSAITMSTGETFTLNMQVSFMTIT